MPGTGLSQWEVNCIEYHFERHFQPFRTELGWKVVVELYADRSEVRRGYRTVGKDLICIDQYLNCGRYRASSTDPRKRQLLNALYLGASRLAKRVDWPISPFKDARDAVLRDHLIYAEPLIRRPVRNLQTSQSAICGFVFGQERIDLFVGFSETGSDTISEHVNFASTPPHSMFPHDAFLSCKWVRSRRAVEVRLQRSVPSDLRIQKRSWIQERSLKNGREVFRVEIPAPPSSMH
jgi:hypothetical protein